MVHSRGKNEVIMRDKYQLNLNKIVPRNEDLKRKRIRNRFYHYYLYLLSKT